MAHRKTQSLVIPKSGLFNNARLPCPKIRKVTCLGSGFVGGPTSAIMALKSDVIVTVVDINAERIAYWKSDTLPIYEPGLDTIVYLARDGIKHSEGHFAGRDDFIHSVALENVQIPRRPSLFFSTDVDRAIEEADLILVCVNTPTKSNGLGKGAGADLSNVEIATRNIARVAKTSKIIVEKSTVPCRTAESIREIVRNLQLIA